MLRKIRSKYITNIIFDYLQLNLRLKIIKYTKKLQNLISIKKSDYKEYSQIIIEIMPVSDESLLSEKNNIFFNYIKNTKKEHYHIYFNNNLNNEILRNYFDKNEKIEKIKICLDNNITSFCDLFNGCKIIEEINFINFKRKNITNMDSLFSGCNSLTKINFNDFNTENVTDMNHMFFQCFFLRELDLSKFNTKKVTNMKRMFFECRSLENLIFGENFLVNNVKDLSYMFCKCYYLNDLDISNFFFNSKVDMSLMFKDCSKKLIKRIKEQNKNIKDKAFR